MTSSLYGGQTRLRWVTHGCGAAGCGADADVQPLAQPDSCDGFRSPCRADRLCGAASNRRVRASGRALRKDAGAHRTMVLQPRWRRPGRPSSCPWTGCQNPPGGPADRWRGWCRTPRARADAGRVRIKTRGRFRDAHQPSQAITVRPPRFAPRPGPPAGPRPTLAPPSTLLIWMVTCSGGRWADAGRTGLRDLEPVRYASNQSARPPAGSYCFAPAQCSAICRWACSIWRSAAIFDGFLQVVSPKACCQRGRLREHGHRARRFGYSQ